MSQRKMVSHNGIRQSDHGGMGSGGGDMNYTGGTPGFYSPGGPGRGGRTPSPYTGKGPDPRPFRGTGGPSGAPGLGGNPMQGQPQVSIPSQPPSGGGDMNYTGGTPGFYSPGGPGRGGKPAPYKGRGPDPRPFTGSPGGAPGKGDMNYAGGTPGFYSPGGPGRGGQTPGGGLPGQNIRRTGPDVRKPTVPQPGGKRRSVASRRYSDHAGKAS